MEIRFILYDGKYSRHRRREMKEVSVSTIVRRADSCGSSCWIRRTEKNCTATRTNTTDLEDSVVYIALNTLLEEGSPAGDVW